MAAILLFYDFLIFADKEMLLLHTKVDLVATLGGDGTVLWVCAFTFFFNLDESECLIALTYGFGNYQSALDEATMQVCFSHTLQCDTYLLVKVVWARNS
jgi:hypothetical protein